MSDPLFSELVSKIKCLGSELPLNRSEQIIKQKGSVWNSAHWTSTFTKITFFGWISNRTLSFEDPLWPLYPKGWNKPVIKPVFYQFLDYQYYFNSYHQRKYKLRIESLNDFCQNISIFELKIAKPFYFWNQCRKEADPTYNDSEIEFQIDSKSITDGVI